MAEPDDLLPLGIVHNDEQHRESLIKIINEALKSRKITLWGYPNEHSPTRAPLPVGCELDWFAGPDRGECDNPNFPELAYYCDVSAYPSPRAWKLGGYLYRNDIGKTWTEILIRGQDLVRAQKTREWIDDKNCSFGEAWGRAAQAPSPERCAAQAAEEAPPAPSSEQAIIEAPTPAGAAPQQTAERKPPINPLTLIEWMKEYKKKLGNKPPPDIVRVLWPLAKEKKFPKKRVSRQAVQVAAKAVFGKLGPGKRK